MNLVWFRIRSWHAVVPNRGLVWHSLCGRRQPEGIGTTNERGAGKSCETCLRAVARMAGE